MTLQGGLICSVLLFIAMFGTALLLNAASNRPVNTCMTLDDREHTRELTFQAIDEAFGDHVKKLFAVWLKDYRPEPREAMAGMANGISAYQRARANAMQWTIPVCPE